MTNDEKKNKQEMIDLLTVQNAQASTIQPFKYSPPDQAKPEIFTDTFLQQVSTYFPTLDQDVADIAARDIKNEHRFAFKDVKEKANKILLENTKIDTTEPTEMQIPQHPVQHSDESTENFKARKIQFADYKKLVREQHTKQLKIFQELRDLKLSMQADGLLNGLQN